MELSQTHNVVPVAIYDKKSPCALYLFLDQIRYIEPGIVNMIEEYFSLYFYVSGNLIRIPYDELHIFKFKGIYCDSKLECYFPYNIECNLRRLFRKTTFSTELVINGYCNLNKNDLSFNKLCSLEISDPSIKLPVGCFKNSSLTHLKINTNIPKDGCTKCSLLNIVILGPGCKDIGASSFSHCIRLWDIHIPETVEIIRSCAYYKSGLHTITFEERDNKKLTLYDRCFANNFVSYSYHNVKFPQNINYKGILEKKKKPRLFW